MSAGGAAFGYDALDRLLNIHSSTTPIVGFAYDGFNRIAEYQTTSSISARYVHGPGIDNPIVWYNGSAINNTTRRFLMADERGGIVSITDSAGTTTRINSYDEYGIRAGQCRTVRGHRAGWLPEVGMWYYKARMYSPTLGRFMQTDPIGYGDGMNWHHYIGSDPVNIVVSSGLSDCHYEQWATFRYSYQGDRLVGREMLPGMERMEAVGSCSEAQRGLIAAYAAKGGGQDGISERGR